MKKKSSGSSRQERPRQVKNRDIILTEKIAKEIAQLKRRKINTTDKDAPEITEWKNLAIGKFYRPIKKQITIRIDADVLEWFKHASKKYQSLMNQACREYMQHHSAPKSSKK